MIARRNVASFRGRQRESTRSWTVVGTLRRELYFRCRGLREHSATLTDCPFSEIPKQEWLVRRLEHEGVFTAMAPGRRRSDPERVGLEAGAPPLRNVVVRDKLQI